jgi:hypothetical protein
MNRGVGSVSFSNKSEQEKRGKQQVARAGGRQAFEAGTNCQTAQSLKFNANFWPLLTSSYSPLAESLIGTQHKHTHTHTSMPTYPTEGPFTDEQK